MRNPNFSRLQGNYLFPEIAKRKTEFLQKYPAAKLLSLGIGDTTLPIVPSVAEALAKAARDLGTPEGYRGYGAPNGSEPLREALIQKYYPNLSPDEVFISDGAKCDVGRLQILFGDEAKIAVQNPTYPVYVDTTLISGKKPPIQYMECTPENDFFPDLSKLENPDVIYFCSPNNPTGNAVTKEQLQELVDYARENKAIIIFDAAYACFISKPHLPRTIYEIDGADEVAIELGSFSKMAGFTGVRLGWSVVPKKLPFYQEWFRIISTFFNGPCNIAEAGGLAALKADKEIQGQIDTYMNNAKLIKEAFSGRCYGGNHAPYIWVNFKPQGSWDAFNEILHEYHIVTTPGAGFGSAGEGFVRFSAFAKPDDCKAACKRFNLKNI